MRPAHPVGLKTNVLIAQTPLLLEHAIAASRRDGQRSIYDPMPWEPGVPR
mgnify:CR=1 FL=1